MIFFFPFFPVPGHFFIPLVFFDIRINHGHEEPAGAQCDQAVQAVQCLHTAFGLDSDDVFVETQLSAEEIAAKMKKGR